MPKAPSTRSKAVFKHMVKVFGIEPKIFNHYNPAETVQIDEIHARATPDGGWTTYATVTLNEHRNEIDGKDVPVEAYIVVAGEAPDAGEALATCAFNVVTDGWIIAPGVVHRDVVAMYPGLAPHLPHMLFTFPMDFGDELARIETPQGEVFALQAFPISEAEADLLESDGFDALEARFEAAEVDYTDLSRRSVV